MPGVNEMNAFLHFPANTKYCFSILLLLIVLVCQSISVSAPARAATFPVNSGFDRNDLEPGNDRCVAYIVVVIPAVFTYCTLRAAVEEANALPGEDIIVLGSGTYRLALAGRDEDAAATGDLDITDSVQIIGAGADKTIIDADGLDRVFDIHGSDTRIVLSDLTISNGNEGQGAGIRNRGNLTLNRVILRDNQAGVSTSNDYGGALYNGGQCTLRSCSLTRNQAGVGGAIYNSSTGNLTISATTLSQNRALQGGALFNGGTASLTNTTIGDNRADFLGGGLFNAGQGKLVHCTIAENKGGGLYNRSKLTIANSIVSGNTPDNCRLDTLLNSDGGNLDDGQSCLLGQKDLRGQNPHLQPLTDNGGLTLTMALGPGSPAVDTGIALTTVTTDQRGEQRPARQGADIGAYELQPYALPASIYPLLFR